MMKNQKGFTLVELLAVIVILAVIILIAVNAVLPQMEKARKNSLADEALNYAKAAETAYVSNSMEDGASDKLCFSIEDDLNGEYVSKNNTSYKGTVTLTIDNGKVTGKQVSLTNGKYYVCGDATGTLSEKDVEDGQNKFLDCTYVATCPSTGSGD